MKAAKILLVSLLFIQVPSLVLAATPSPLAQYVRELRNDYSFGTPQAHDWEGNMLSLQAKAAAGDLRAISALAAAPAYLEYQRQLADRRDLTDAEALHLYQLGLPIHMAGLPSDISPLGDVEALTINFYTAKTYLTLNADIASHWNGKPKAMATYAATLDQALLKLPAYNGLVYHVMDMGASEFAKQRVGYKQKYVYYLSTSSEKIGWQGNVRMIIHSTSGRMIERFSINPQEHEVLIMRNVNFQVIRDPVLVNGVYEIEYQEVP